MKGRVAVLPAYGGKFELREYPVPDPEPGAILVKLTRAGVCGSDLHIWRGEMKEIYGSPPRDLTFGHEMCGRVERLGAGVTVDSAGQPLREGDRVTFLYFFPPGGFIFHIPDEVSDDVATPANCALAQVLYGLTRAGLRQGDTAVIQGAGGLGLNAVAVARDVGADRIIVLDRVASRLELARAFGADHALSLADLTTPERRIQAVMDLTGGFGADVVADFVGYPDVVPEGLKMLRGGGCYLEVGSIAPGNVFSYDATALVRGNVRLVATSNYSPWALAQALAFLRRNRARFPFERLVSHVFPLAQISDAFQEADWMQRGSDGLRISRAALSMAS